MTQINPHRSEIEVGGKKFSFEVNSVARQANGATLVRVGDTAPFIEALAARKVHVRDRSKDPTTPGCIRITTGILEHTRAAIDALESVTALRLRSGEVTP